MFMVKLKHDSDQKPQDKTVKENLSRLLFFSILLQIHNMCSDYNKVNMCSFEVGFWCYGEVLWLDLTLTEGAKSLFLAVHKSLWIIKLFMGYVKACCSRCK